VLDVLQAGAMYAAIGLFRAHDVDRASELGGRLSRRLMHRRLARASTIETIRIAFPEIDDAGLERLVGDMAESLGRGIAETAHLAAFMGEAGRARFAFEGLSNLEAALARGRPLLIVSGHFGNFELAFVALHHAGVRSAAITRRPNNRFVADWAARNRARLGFDLQFTNEHSGTRQMFARLRAGGNVGMLIDQAVADGIPAPLFGRPAMTTLTPATLALELDVTILPMAVRRQTGAHFKAVFHPAILPPGSGNAARDIFAMTGAINAFVEEEVRARPADWLWMHRRWKPVATLSRRALRLLDEAGMEVPPQVLSAAPKG
jgi:KDO2-lipid IV(A) lauroyltransferase